MALDKDRDRSQSPDRNQRRRFNKRDLMIQRELSAMKKKPEQSGLKI
jgi:hypothetical protein